MDKNETPWKRSVLEMLNKRNSVELMPSEKNPINCQMETSVMDLPPTPLVKMLGYGTGVQVYVVKRNLTTEERSPWAIKMLSARDDPSNRAMFDKRLSEEAVILKKLNHPNIVGFRNYDTIEVGRSFLALEYCNASLGDILEKRYSKNAGPLEADKAKRMSIHVLRGLVYLHEEAHILHGDLKSFNVLINKDFESAKICDFGVSVPLNNEGYLDLVKTPEARYIGTTLWSAPEVFKNDPSLIGVKADIFAFGMIIYETLTLTPPHTFSGIMDEVITHPVSIAKRRLDMSTEGDVDDEEGAESDEVSEGLSIDDGEEEEIESEVESQKRVLVDDDEEPLQKKLKTTSAENIPASGSIISLESTSSNADEEPSQKKLKTTTAEPMAASGSVISLETTSSNTDDGSTTTPVPMADSNGEEPISERKAIVHQEEDIISISSGESVEDIEEDSEGSEGSDCEAFDVDYDEDDEFAQEDAEYEEDGCEDGQYLNYAVLGTRPPLPSHIDIGDDHLPLVEMFHICTEARPADRPTARQLLDALTKTMSAQGVKDALDKQTVDIETQPCHLSTKAMPAQDGTEPLETPKVDNETQPSDIKQTAN